MIAGYKINVSNKLTEPRLLRESRIGALTVGTQPSLFLLILDRISVTEY